MLAQRPLARPPSLIHTPAPSNANPLPHPQSYQPHPASLSSTPLPLPTPNNSLQPPSSTTPQRQLRPLRLQPPHISPAHHIPALDILLHALAQTAILFRAQFIAWVGDTVREARFVDFRHEEARVGEVGFLRDLGFEFLADLGGGLAAAGGEGGGWGGT